MPGSEFSYGWTTVASSATGDQQLNSSGYTQAMFSDEHIITSGCHGGEGIAAGGLLGRKRSRRR